MSGEGDQPPFDQFARIFGDFFGGGALAGRGEDLTLPLELPADLARTGTRRTLTVERRVPCGACGGAGGETRPCPRCDGSGRAKHTQGFFQIVATCADCRGRGKQITRPCGACDEGSLLRGETLTVQVPADVHSGVKLRLAGKGHQRAGLPPGDLFIALTVLGEPPAAIDEGAIAAAGAHPFRERHVAHAVAPAPARALARPSRRWVPAAALLIVGAALLAALLLR